MVTSQMSLLDMDTFTAEPAEGLAVDFLQVEPEGALLPLPLLVVDGKVFGILLVLPLDRRHMLQGAAVTEVPGLAPVSGHQYLATDQAVTTVDSTAPVVAQSTLAITAGAQGTVTLGAGLAGSQVSSYHTPPEGYPRPLTEVTGAAPGVQGTRWTVSAGRNQAILARASCFFLLWAGACQSRGRYRGTSPRSLAAT